MCNIARASSLYGEFMRALFGAGEGLYQFGFDFASLEARVQAHYIYSYLGGPELGEALLAEKPNDIHCYSEDTEILTEKGWKTFDKVTKDIKVAQWTTENTIQFVKPTEVVWQPYSGDMVSLESNNLSLLVTPNHRMVYKQVKSSYKETVASSFIKNNITSDVRIPLGGIVTNTRLTHSDDFCKLIIATQADGTLLKDCSGIQFEFKKERKIERLQNILDSLEAVYTVTETTRSTTRIYIKSSLLTKNIRFFLTSSKDLSSNVLKLSKSNLTVLLEEVKYWDGTLTKSNVILDTTSKETVDILQAVSHLLNYKATVNQYDKQTDYGTVTLYRLTLSLKAKPFSGVLTTSPQTVPYKGFIGCVAVPSTYVVIRRNGKVSISGNTLNAKKLGISRDNAKSITYALLYGAAAPKLQKMLGLSPAEAEKMFNDYWDAVPPLKELRDNLVKYWEKVDRDHIIGIDGRKLRARSPHSLINLLFQSAGAILAKWSVVRIAELLEEQGLLGNPFEHTTDEVKVWQMIVYHVLNRGFTE